MKPTPELEHTTCIPEYNIQPVDFTCNVQPVMRSYSSMCAMSGHMLNKYDCPFIEKFSNQKETVP